MSGRRYIFLDVDGVLHPARWGVPGITPAQEARLSIGEYELQAAIRGLRATVDGPLFSCLPLFEAVVRPHLDHLQIVITSSWRRRPESYQAMLAAMSPDVRARVTGATPTGRDRADEVNRWLQEHAAEDARSIVVDDDDTHDWRFLTRRAILMLAVTERGFDEEDGRCLARLLDISPSVFDALRAALPAVCNRQALVDELDNLENERQPPPG